MTTVQEIAEQQEKKVVNLLHRTLDRTKALLKKFIVADEDVFNVLAVWIAMTYIYELFDYIAYLLIHSAERESGKSTVLEWVSNLSHNPLLFSGTSASGLLRLGDELKPTLFIDEMDNIIKKGSTTPENQDITGILNSGFKRVGGTYIKQIPVGNSWKPTPFTTYYPKAMASIGVDLLHDTTRSRCIMIPMSRKTKEQSKGILRNINRVKVTFDDEIQAIKDNFREWANESQCNEILVDLPMQLSDRAIDIYEPLLQIAHEANGDWFAKVTESAIHLSGAKDNLIETGTQLLIDIHDIIKDMGDDEWMQTTDLINRLCEEKYAESGWSTYSRGTRISARALSRITKRYKIEIKKKNSGSGYVVRSFKKPIESFAMEHIRLPPQTTTTTTSTTADTNPTPVNTNNVAEVADKKDFNSFRIDHVD